jgi:hypothetical protein
MSARPAFLGLGLLATVLAAAIALELDDAAPPAGSETEGVAIRQKAKAEPRAAAQDHSDRTDNWLATALARPLFSRDRRPTDAEPNSGTGTTRGSLPRLTGVVIGPFGQSAIFAATDGGRPTVLTVGQTLGEYTVERIEPAGVTVSGPEGRHQVSLAADVKERHDMAAELPRPSPAQVQAQAQHPGQAPGQQPHGFARAPRPPNSRPPSP